MEHAREIDLIELAAGRLGPERLASVQAHLEQCPLCRHEFEQVRRTWDILGAWEVRPEGQLDLAAPVLARGAAVPRIIPFPHSARFPVGLRFAAAIVVTMLIGYMGGRLTGRQATSASAGQPPQYVSALALGVVEGLSSLVLQDEPPVTEEGRT